MKNFLGIIISLILIIFVLFGNLILLNNYKLLTQEINRLQNLNYQKNQEQDDEFENLKKQLRLIEQDIIILNKEHKL